MLIVETVGRIRREHFAKGKTIKEIARGLRGIRFAEYCGRERRRSEEANIAGRFEGLDVKKDVKRDL